MNFELKKQELSSLKCVPSTPAEQSIDLELNLPDYCSDIKRILKCNVFTSVNSLRRTGNSVTANGEIVLRLVYVGADERLDCFEHKLELSKGCEFPQLEESASVLCDCAAEYINCRAASQRRICVNGNVSVIFKAYSFEKTQLVSQIEGSGAQTLCEKSDVTTVTAAGEKCFDMSETVSLSQDMPPIGKIIRSDSFVTMESVKAVSGKLLVKGELVVEIAYCADTERGSVCCLRHSMPLSQIIELPEVTEETDCFVSLSVRALSLQPRSDSSGTNRLLEVAAKLCAFVKGTREISVSAVADCYSTSCALKGEYSFASFERKIYNFKADETLQKTVELSGQGISEVLDLRSIKNTSGISFSGDKLELHLSVLVGVIFTDGDGNIQYVEKNLDFTLDGRLPQRAEKVLCEPFVTVKGLKSAVVGNEKLQLTVDVCADFDVYSSSQKRVCGAVKEDENAEKKDGSALIIYFAKKGERLWDVAKRYSSTPEAISRENDLAGEKLVEDKMLMIPCGG